MLLRMIEESYIPADQLLFAHFNQMRDCFLAVDLVKVKGGDRAYPEMDWDPATMLM